MIGTIVYIKTVSKKKPSIGRIKTHLLRTGNEKKDLSLGNLETLLQDMCRKSIIEFGDNACKIKEPQDPKLIEETQSEITSQWSLFSQ